MSSAREHLVDLLYERDQIKEWLQKQIDTPNKYTWAEKCAFQSVLDEMKKIEQGAEEDVIDEIIRQECVKAMKYCDEKQYKYLRKTHNYFVFPEDKIKKDKK